MGILLLLFGVQWLRKGIVRVSVSVRAKKRPALACDLQWTPFVIALKGVLLQGLQIIFIVIAFGAATHQRDVPILAALSAFAIVVLATLFASRVLRNIPDHVIKFAVGVLLATFGTYWAAEGLGVNWPGNDLAILAILALYLAHAFVCMLLLRGRATS